MTVPAYPNDNLWKDSLLLAAGDERRASRGWLEEVARDLGFLASDGPAQVADLSHVPASVFSAEVERDWAADADAIADRFDASDWTALDDARALISMERDYARALGISQPLVLSLVRFSRLIEQKQSHIADEWCAEARDWQPWNPYAWVVGMRSRRRFDAVGATELGWGAVERFPDNPLAVRELAVAIMMSGMPGEAEVLLRSALTRFPATYHLLDVLADSLLRQDRIDDAFSVLSEYPRARLPDSLYARRLEAIENAKAKGVSPPSPAASDGELRRFAASRIRTLRRAAPSTSDPEAFRARASELLETARAHQSLDPRLLAEQVLLHLAEDDPGAAAFEVARHSRLSRHPSLAYSAVRVWRDQARREQRSFAEAHAEAEDVASVIAAANADNLPVAHLAALRSIASLSDGHVKMNALEERGNVLAAWINRIARDSSPGGTMESSDAAGIEEATFLPTHLASRAFVNWWTRAVEQLVLVPASADGGSGEALEAALSSNAAQLDALEEDFVARATVGA
jgi:hypothetical protein